MANIYASEKACGVDTKQFYRSLGSNMYAVSLGTGISRTALSRVPIHRARKQVADITFEFLENEMRRIYLEHVRDVQQELNDAWTSYLELTKIRQQELDEEWEQYKNRDCILNKSRMEYGLERKQPRMEKVILRPHEIVKNEE